MKQSLVESLEEKTRLLLGWEKREEEACSFMESGGFAVRR